MDTLNKHLYGIKENIKVLNYALYAFTYRKDETGELSVWDEMIKNLLEEHISNVEEKVDAIQTQIEIIKEQYKESKKGEYKFEVGKLYEGLDLRNSQYLSFEVSNIDEDGNLTAYCPVRGFSIDFNTSCSIAVSSSGNYVMFANGIPDEYKPDAKDKDGGE